MAGQGLCIISFSSSIYTWVQGGIAINYITLYIMLNTAMNIVHTYYLLYISTYYQLLPSRLTPTPI